MPKLKCCPECGRAFAPDVQLGAPETAKQRIYDFVAKHPEGVTVEQIMNHLYHDRRDGGPESRNIIPVQIVHINRRLEALGYECRIEGRGGPNSVYTWREHGKTISRAPLTPEQREAIIADKRKLKAIAFDYNRSLQTISQIKRMAGLRRKRLAGANHAAHPA